ncbi:MAG: hypothetical protein ABEN55_01575, partial [Bradymonadaceae bacterium]
WNGGDYHNNTFRGHFVWTGSGANHCRAGGHYAGIAVFQNGSGQYDNADITGTNWMSSGVDHTKVDISFFVR